MAAIIVGPTNWQPQAAEEYEIQDSSLGDQIIRGGYLICRSGGGVAWIVAPASSEVSRNWHSRNDAVTTATNCTSATGWFVPSHSQLKNPGSCCKIYWDSYSSAFYWSNTQLAGNNACNVYLPNGYDNYESRSNTHCVRAFRCVTY